MKRTVSMLLALAMTLCLCSCAQTEEFPQRLSQEEIESLREEYPYAETYNVMADMAVYSLEEQLNRKVKDYFWGLAVVEINSDEDKHTTYYTMDSSSPEAALNAKLGGNGVDSVDHSYWDAILVEDIFGNIPERVINDGHITLYKVKRFRGLLPPEMEKGQRYLMLLAMLPEDNQSTPEKVNMCSVNAVFYLTDSGYLLSSREEHDEYSGISLAEFTSEIKTIQKDIPTENLVE